MRLPFPDLSKYALPPGWGVNDDGDPVGPEFDQSGNPIGPAPESQAAAKDLLKEFGLGPAAGAAFSLPGMPPNLFGAAFFKAVQDDPGPTAAVARPENIVTSKTFEQVVDDFLAGIDVSGQSAQFNDAYIGLRRSLRKGIIGMTGDTRLVDDPDGWTKKIRSVLGSMVTPPPEPRDIEAIYERLADRMFAKEPDPEKLTLADVDDAEMMTAIGYELGRMVRGGRMDGRAIAEVFKRAEALKAKRDEVRSKNRQMDRMAAGAEFELQSGLFNRETADVSNYNAMMNRMTEQAATGELNQESAVSQQAMGYLAQKFLDPNYAVGFIRKTAAAMDKYVQDLKSGLQKVGIPAQQVLILGDIARSQIKTAAAIAPPEYRQVLMALADKYDMEVDAALKQIGADGFTTDVLRAAQTAEKRAQAALTGKQVSSYEEKFWREGLALWNQIRQVSYAHADNMAALSLKRQEFDWSRYIEGEKVDVAKAALALNGMKFMSEAQARQAGQMLEAMKAYSGNMGAMVDRRNKLFGDLQELEQSRQIQTLDPDGSKRKAWRDELAMLDKAIAGIPLLPGLTGDGKVDAKAMKQWDEVIKGLQNPGSLTPEQRQELFYQDPNQAMMDAMLGLGDGSVFFGSTYKKFAQQAQGFGSMYGLPGMSYGGGLPGLSYPGGGNPLTDFGGGVGDDFWGNFVPPPEVQANPGVRDRRGSNPDRPG